MASSKLKEELNSCVLDPMIGLRVGQLIEVLGMLENFTAVLVFGLSVIIVALCTVVYRLQKGRLVLLQHIGGGAAAGQQNNRTKRYKQRCHCKLIIRIRLTRDLVRTSEQLWTFQNKL